MSYVWFYLLVVLLVLAYLVMLKQKETFYQNENNSENEMNNVVQTSSSSIDSVTTSALLQEDDKIVDFNINFSIIDDSEKVARDVDSNKLNRCLGNHLGRKVKSFRDVSELMYNNVEDCNIYDATEVNIRENEGTRYFEQIPYW